MSFQTVSGCAIGTRYKVSVKVNGFDAEIDAIIVDPPYGKEHLPLYEQLALLAKRALKPNAVLAVICGESYLPEILSRMTAHMRYRWTLSYAMPIAAVRIWPRRIYCRWKPVLLFGGTAHWVRDTLVPGALDKQKVHEWQQCETGMSALLEALTLPGEKICDPMVGSGSTAIAALKMGRNFVGCNIDPIAVRIASSVVAKIGQQFVV